MEYYDLSQVREALVEAQILLRGFDEKAARVQAEDRAIKAAPKDAKGKPDYGANDTERCRYLAVAITDDPAYGAFLMEMRSVQADIDRLQAKVEFFHDERRRYEWGIRSRLVEALERLGAQSDSDEPAGDAAFDDVMDHAADRIITGNGNEMVTDEDSIEF